MFFEDPRERFNNMVETLGMEEAIQWAIRIYGSYHTAYKSLPRRYFKYTGSGYVSVDRKAHFSALRRARR